MTLFTSHFRMYLLDSMGNGISGDLWKQATEAQMSQKFLIL